jgi:hypothetical protein
MQFNKLLSTAALLVLAHIPAFAADKHGHDHKPMYGGIVAEAADLNFELVAKSDSLILYVTDHGKPAVTSGAKALATVFASGDKTPVTFEPAGENKLVAKGNFKTGVGVRVAASIMLAGQPEAKVSFKLK